MDKAEVIKTVCELFAENNIEQAKTVAREKYPFIAQQPLKRSYTAIQSTRVFVRDGFIDRYTDQRLVFPGALRLLSVLMPEEFPAHPNWKLSESHIVYYELFPTIDHTLAIARGGVDNEANWVTVSMATNSAKSLWTHDEIAARLRPPSRDTSWDGLMSWFVEYWEHYPYEGNARVYLARWYRAAVAVSTASVQERL